MEIQLRESTPVIGIDNATIIDDRTETIAVSEMNLNLNFGELAMIHLGRRDIDSVIGDACTGLTAPSAGTVTFLGQSWSEISSDRANAMRGMIGRVFKTANWMDYMTILDALLLSQLHHTRRTEEDIRSEALQRCRVFGLPGLPNQRPGTMRPADLQRAACARAFIGRPRLIILEDPVRNTGRRILSGLTKCIHEALDWGAGVIWMTRDDSVWRRPYTDCTHRFLLAGSKLVESTE